MLARSMMLLIITIVVGTAIGYASAYRMASFAAVVGGVYGAIAGTIASPVVLVGLRRKNLLVGVLAVFGPACLVALLSSAAMSPLWSIVVTLGIVCGNSTLCYYLVPNIPHSAVHARCGCGYDLTGNESGVCPECGITSRTKQAEYSIARVTLTMLCLLTIPSVLAYATFGRTSKRATPTAIPQLTERLAHHDIQLRYDAQQKLLTHGTEPLLSALRHDNPCIRANAAEALGWSRDASVVADLTTLLEDSDSHVRLAAVNALEQIGGVVAELHISTMLNDSDINVRHDAIRALGILQVKDSAPAVSEQLDDPSPYIVREAAETVGTLGYAESIPKLVSLLNDPRKYVAEDCVIAIARIDGQQVPDAAWQRQLEVARKWWNREGKSKYSTP